MSESSAQESPSKRSTVASLESLIKELVAVSIDNNRALHARLELLEAAAHPSVLSSSDSLPDSSCPLVRSQDFLQFLEVLLSAISTSDDPTNVVLQRAMPINAEGFRALNRRVDGFTGIVGSFRQLNGLNTRMESVESIEALPVHVTEAHVPALIIAL